MIVQWVMLACANWKNIYILKNNTNILIEIIFKKYVLDLHSKL